MIQLVCKTTSLESAKHFQKLQPDATTAGIDLTGHIAAQPVLSRNRSKTGEKELHGQNWFHEHYANSESLCLSVLTSCRHTGTIGYGIRRRFIPGHAFLLNHRYVTARRPKAIQGRDKCMTGAVEFYSTEQGSQLI